MSVRSLAQAVIRQAVLDYILPVAAGEREPARAGSARSFLYSSHSRADLETWCNLAGYNITQLRTIVGDYQCRGNPLELQRLLIKQTHLKRRLSGARSPMRP